MQKHEKWDESASRCIFTYIYTHTGIFSSLNFEEHSKEIYHDSGF